MKAGWKMKSLGEVSVINYGYTESATSDPIGPKFLRITDIQDSGVNWDDVPFCQIDATGLKKFKLAQGDIVFARTGATTGKSFLVINPPEAVFASYLIRLRLQDISLLPEFVSLYFQSKEYWDAIRAGSSGSAQGGFNASKLAALMIPVPPLPEQQRIVAILDEAFETIAAARANAEQNCQNARALFESYLQSVFSQRGDGWINKPLSELCDIKHGFAFKSEYFTNEGDYTLLTPGNFFETGGYRDRGDKQKFYSGDIPQGFLLEAGDLLVAMTEQAAGLLGSPIIVPSQGKFLHNQRLGLVSGKPGMPWLNEFFFHVFNTQAVRQAIHESASGAKVRHTSPTKIGAVTVAFPASIEEQKAIVATLDTLTIETQRLESLYQRKIAALDELKQSLLQQAFSGQL
ncbi:restriction endonuclease subunit S [Aeromonas hydrophila]|uniref:restriction endonuclease subunit S n=1 Tax=Aeromonas hydrophila TaxID=644 RepID=UPI0009B82F60|nr:restriction endonuclease subunit S [Aeromonas hydrophila]